MSRERSGLFQAVVKNTQDPLGIGRIKVSCPDLMGTATSYWILPCGPVTGDALPLTGSSVWVACEMNDPDHLVWLGSTVLVAPGTNNATVTTPAFPASGVSAINTMDFPVMAYVTATGGTITAISVNGTTITGFRSGAFRLLSGWTINITYTGSVVWTWIPG
jgi:hypothetical protein